jgi:hypothetical protein
MSNCIQKRKKVLNVILSALNRFLQFSQIVGNCRLLTLLLDPSNNSTYSNWGIIKHGVPQGSTLGPLFFLIYINDMPPTINSQSKPILSADDINIIISHPDIDCFQICMNDVFAGLNKWIKASKFTLYFDKINFMKFSTYNKNCINLCFGYEDKTIGEVETTKFLGL